MKKLLVLIVFLVSACASASLTTSLEIGQNEWLIQSWLTDDLQVVEDVMTEATRICHDNGERTLSLDTKQFWSNCVCGHRVIHFTCEDVQVPASETVPEGHDEKITRH